MQFHKNFNQNPIKSYFIIIGATLLLYFWQLHLYPMINPDGVTYIEAAAAYLTGGFKAAVAIDAQAKWPFYSILIAKVNAMSGLPLLLAARLIDLFFICFSAALFLYLVRLFSKHAGASFWAIIIWISWHEYSKWWPTVVRDHGFLTCLLLSFICYYRLIVTHRFFWAFAWSISLILAELFRIEAVIYLVFVPFSVFFLKQGFFKDKLFLWLKLNALTLLAGMGVVILFANHTLTLNSLRFAYMWQEFSLIFSVIYNEFVARYHIMNTSIFYRENHYVEYALLMAYVGCYIAYVIGQISLAVLLPIFFIKRVLQKLDRILLSPPFVTYLSISALIPLFFFAEHVFLNGRYLLPLGVFLLLLAASIFPHVIELFVGKKQVIFVGLAGILLLLNLISSVFHFGRVSQDYYSVGVWLKENYPNKTVFTNNKILLFYNSASPDYKNGGVYEMKWDGIGVVWLRKHDQWCNDNFLAIVAPANKAADQQKMFAQFQAKNALGPIILHYSHSANKEIILVAPIHRDACVAMVNQRHE